MPDMLIRNVPESVLAALEVRAARAGLSRAEYVRRRLAADAAATAAPVTVEDLRTFTDRLADLADPDVMDQAWR